MKTSSPFRVEKYWGWFEVLVTTPDYCLKRMWMKAGRQSSLEYHVKKVETYIVEHGVLVVGLRMHRARNVAVRLVEGDVWHIPSGQMHMRIAETDVLITEVSTHDDPHGTHIVEDGKTYHHTYEEML